jgi:preprotein translocase subunit SecA
MGKGVHIVTVNDYLARRDAVWMGQIYEYLGLSSAVINHESSFKYDPTHTEVDALRDESGSFKVRYEFLRPCTRREAYEADITYGTNSEFGFDYLRDNLEYKKENLRQRDPYFAIVDEMDSILIDEARTPLIISAPTQDSDELYRTFARIAKGLVRDTDFTVDEKFHSIAMTDAGITKAEKMLGVGDLYTDKGVRYVHHLETAVKAEALYVRDKQYVVKDGEVVIVDEFTGRLQPGRRWSEGLHQAVEAKEGVAVQKESRTYATITYQNYFRQYEKLSGMTGTAETSSEEFFKVYGLHVVQIPTHRSIARVDHNDLIFQTEKGKFQALAARVKELHAKGQPVLIGTVSIEKNELLSAYLTREGIPHQVLNAKNHEREGEIVAQAGKKGGVTIATNMAGRGVDIKLGGTPTTPETTEEIKKIGGLFVIGTERHEARRIDNQLRGRSGRQGDPGETQFFVSLEDDLMRIFAKDSLKTMMGRFGIAEDQPIENKLITRTLESAQKKIEGFHFDSRKWVLEFDDVMNTQREAIYSWRKTLLCGTDEAILARFKQIEDKLAPEFKEKVATKRTELGLGVFTEALRVIMLQTIDMYWVEHLESMDHLRNSVNLRAFGQRDPLVEFKKEGLQLFKQLTQSIEGQIVEMILRVEGRVVQMQSETQKQAEKITAGSGGVTGGARTPGRNDPCSCGSGKKYKKCHGA